MTDDLTATLDYRSDTDAKIHVLWADIVGFSAISVALSQETDGRELVTRAIADLISYCLEVSLAQGAELINLGGDSWVVAWSSSNSEAATRATTTAALSHQSCHHFSNKYGIQLKLRIACADGEVFRSLIDLGGGRKNIVLHGAVIRSASRLLERCEPGGTLVAFQNFAVAVADQTNKNNANPNYEMVKTSMHHAQRGVCTAVFATMRLDALSDETVGVVIKEFAQQSRALCQQFNAVLARIRVDEKGCTALILVGFGSHAPIDGARQALAIARLLSLQMRSHQQDVSIALCSGPVFACEMGHTQLAEFTAMGECVNLAAQIASSHSKGIRLDAITAESSESALHIAAWETLVPKGTQSARLIARLLTEGAQNHIPFFVTADTQPMTQAQRPEIQRLEVAHIAQLLHSKPSWVCLIGEAGMGKSVALGQITRVLRETAGMSVISGRCLPEHALSYAGCVSQLVMDWLHQRAPNDVDKTRLVHEVLSACPYDLRGAFMQLARLNALAWQPNSSTRNHPVSQQQSASFFQWWAIQFLSENDLIFIEDLHWIDAVSASCLASMHQSNKLLRCIGSSRTHLAENSLLSQFEEHDLNCLSDLEMSQMACLLLNVQAIDADVIQHAMSLTNGNCMFAVKWLPEAIRRGWYKKTAGGLVLSLSAIPSQQQNHEPPIALHLLLQAQIERLSVTSRCLVSYLSVYGKSILEGYLHHFLGEHEDVQASLTECAQSGVLTIQPSHQAGLLVAFEHDLLREVTYARLDAHSRSLHHQKIALLLDSPIGISSSPMERAWHWMKSTQDTPQGLSKILEGAIWARQANAVDIALLLLEYLVAAYRGHGVRSAKLYKNAFLWLVITRCQTGKTEIATAYLKEAAALQYPQSARLLRTCLYVVRHAVQFTLHHFKNNRWSASDACLTVHEDPGSLSLLLLSEADYFKGDYGASKWHAICAVDAAERTQSTRDLVSAYAGMAVQSAIFHLYSLSAIYAQAAIRLSRKSKDPVYVVEALFFLALRDVGCAHWHRSARHIALANQRNAKLGNTRRGDELLVIQGYMLEGQGKFEAAEAAYSSLWKNGVKREDRQTLAWGYLGCARIAHAQNQWARMDDFLCRLAVKDLPDVLSQLDFAALRALQAMRNNDMSACSQLLLQWPDARIREIAKTTFSAGFAISALYVVVVQLHLNHPTAKSNSRSSTQSLLQSLKIHARMHPYSASRYLICRFIDLHLRGRGASAIQSLRIAQDHAQKFEQPQAIQCVRNLEKYAFQPARHCQELLLSALF